MKLNSEPRKLPAPAPAANLFARFSQWSAQHPVLAILFVSLVAVAINCYPVIFLGKSFVVPAEDLPMLYARDHTILSKTQTVAARGEAIRDLNGETGGEYKILQLFDSGKRSWKSSVYRRFNGELPLVRT